LKKEDKIDQLVQAYVLGTISHQEMEEAVSLLREPELTGKVTSTLEELWDRRQFDKSAIEDRNRLDQILDQIHIKIRPDLLRLQKLRRRRLVRNALKIAAVLVLGLTIGMGFSLLQKSDSLEFTARAPGGSVSHLLLPDSTIVYLNADSEITYAHDAGKNRREVTLDGEAWFRVKGDPKKPFRVRTGFYDVVVTGTEFNVRAYRLDNQIVTTLVEGSVRISPTEDFKMNLEKNLRPGQQLVYNREDHTIVTRKVDPRYYTSWKDNKLVFINMNLSDLVVLLERKYGVEIDVSDRSILQYHYDGTIKNEGILEIMDLLKITLPIEYQVVGQKIIITKTK